MEEENNGFARSSLALSFTAGGIVGAALAILYAPSEGRQTREKIKEFAEEAKEKTTQFSKTWKEKASCFLEKRKEVEEPGAEAFPYGFDDPKTESATDRENLIPQGET